MENLKHFIGKVALYARVASSHPDDATYVEHQRDKLRNFAKQQGFEDYVEYWDVGYSGFDTNRPGFEKLNREIESGTISMVIVKCMDRISRDYHFTHDWQRKVESKGVAVLAIDGSHEPLPVAVAIQELFKQQEAIAVV